MDSTPDRPKNFRTPERWNSVPVPERVSERAITNINVQSDGCWISRYSVASHGYAQIGWSIRDKSRPNGPHIQMVLAHRAAWVHVHGQMPLGMTIDHTCKERRCVNPAHLRTLPNFENARRTHGMDWAMGQCANGHSSENLGDTTGTDKRGNKRPARGCKLCRPIYTARSTWKRENPGEPMPEHLLLRSEQKEVSR